MRTPQRIGYFHKYPSLRYAGEDNECAYRALRAGVPIVYDPTVTVRHVAWQRNILPIYRRYARGRHLLRRVPAAGRPVHRPACRPGPAQGPWLLARGLATRNHDLIAMGRG
jgi:GT2 family glycosyltransferase